MRVTFGMKESQDRAHRGVCVIIQLSHALLPSSIASGIGRGLRVSRTRTSGEAIVGISLRDAVVDTILD